MAGEGHERDAVRPIAFADADYAGDTDTRKSTSGVVVFIADGPVAWYAKRQAVIAVSTAEAEYVALYSTVIEVLHLRQLLGELKFPQLEPTVIMEDNQPCIAIATNPMAPTSVKHMNIKYHFIREAILDRGEIQVKYIDTTHQIADIFTKPLPAPRHCELRAALNMI